MQFLNHWLLTILIFLPSVGAILGAVVTEVDDAGSRIQLVDHPVMARLARERLSPGDRVLVRLTEADPDRRVLAFMLERE